MTTTATASPRPTRRSWWVSLLDVGDPIVRSAADPGAWATHAHADRLPTHRRPTHRRPTP